MGITVKYLFESIVLGIGLAMDAFSVSMANGLNEPKMKSGRMSFIAGTFGVFQFAMPMLGWICVHTILQYFQSFEKFIPWIALLLLLYIGGNMLREGIKHDVDEKAAVGFGALMVQGVATSIDALSVGFTIAEYGLMKAVIGCIVIGIVTFFICMAGLLIGKKVGNKLQNKAAILGGVILIAIGIEIFISGMVG